MKMTLKLNAPGMTSLHKAGLAGLYMTLQAFDETKTRVKGLNWELSANKVNLQWHDEKPKAAFAELTKLSFKLDQNGLFQLTGLEAARRSTTLQKYHLYNALLLSFLQYGKHRKKDRKVMLSDPSDDHFKIIDKEFQPITLYRHQEVVSRKIFVDGAGYFRPTIEIPSWMFPGGVKRHDIHNESAWTEPLEQALALLFAPIGVIYYVIRSRLKGRKALLALVIPEIIDLEEYAKFRQIVAANEILEMHASSSSDAALRFIAFMAGKHASDRFKQAGDKELRCRVVTFGIVDWSVQQKTRTHSRFVISTRLPGLENYQIARAIFPNRWQTVAAKYNRRGVQTEPERLFVSTSCAREFIADNIAKGRVWYEDLTTYLRSKDTREQLRYERKELHEMVEKATYKDEGERLFIRVCHESWRRRLGKLGERARQEHLGEGGFHRLANKEAEKLRSSFSSCKNAESLRQTVVDFWARGGSNKLLGGDGLSKVLALLDENNWKRARDLALLSLISYTDENSQSTTTPVTVTPGGI